MKRIKMLIAYLCLNKSQFINSYCTGETKTERYALYGNSEQGYELHATRKYMGGWSQLTMPRTYYRPLNDAEAIRVIFQGWKAADEIFHARLKEARV